MWVYHRAAQAAAAAASATTLGHGLVRPADLSKEDWVEERRPVRSATETAQTHPDNCTHTPDNPNGDRRWVIVLKLLCTAMMGGEYL